MRIKIGFFNERFPSAPPFTKTSTNNVGGDAKSLFDLITHIDLKKFDCTIFSSGNKKNIQKEKPSKNLTLYRYPTFGSLFNNGNFPKGLIDPRYFFSPNNLDLDIIYCQPGNLSSEMAALNYKRKNKVPLILSIRSAMKVFSDNYYKRMIKEFYLEKIFPTILEKSDIIIVQSKGVLNDFDKLKNFENKICIVPNGVQFDKYNKYCRKVHSLKEGTNQEGKFENNLLFVGSLIERKGILTLLDSYEMILNEYPSTKLIFVGDGPLRGFIREKARKRNYLDKIEIMGYVSKEDLLAKIYSYADLLILPSLQEGFPRVVLESMAAGTPCLVSDIDPNYYAIGEGEYGMIAEVKNSKDFAKKIKKFLEINESNRQKLEKNVVNYAKQHSWIDVARQMEEIFTNILRM